MKTSLMIAAALAASIASAAPGGTETVRLADEPGRAPYQKLLSDSKVGTDSANVNVVSVPAGSRLVIQHIAINTLQSLTDQNIMCSLVVQDSASGLLLIPLEGPKSVTPLRKVISQPIVAYADTQFGVGCTKIENVSGSAGLLSIQVAVTGYYVTK